MSKKKPRARKLVPATAAAAVVPADLVADLRALIDLARDTTARAVNSALVLLYWRIGARIQAEVLKGSRADYGRQILGTLSQQLTAEPDTQHRYLGI